MTRTRIGLYIAATAAFGLISLAASSAMARPQQAKPVFVGTYPGIDAASRQIQVGFKAAGKALKVDVRWLAPTTFDVSQQRQVTESGLSLPNVKGLSVVAADPNSLEGVMRQAKAKGVAISQFSACTPKAVAPICYSTDFAKAGRAVAQRMARLMRNRGEVVIATGTPGDVNHQLRIKGFRAYLKAKAPNIKIVQTIPNCNSPDTATGCAENALSRNPDLTGYYTTGGEQGGAAAVFSRAGKKVVLAAVDDEPTTISGIKNGTISFTYVQQLYCGGYLMVLLPYQMAFKGLFPTKRFVDTGISFVNKSNVNTYKSAVPRNCAKLVKFVSTKVMKKK